MQDRKGISKLLHVSGPYMSWIGGESIERERGALFTRTEWVGAERRLVSFGVKQSGSQHWGLYICLGSDDRPQCLV